MKNIYLTCAGRRTRNGVFEPIFFCNFSLVYSFVMAGGGTLLLFAEMCTERGESLFSQIASQRLVR